MQRTSEDQAEKSIPSSVLTTKNLSKQNRKIIKDCVCANEAAEQSIRL
jgi:hypothetical protein